MPRRLTDIQLLPEHVKTALEADDAPTIEAWWPQASPRERFIARNHVLMGEVFGSTRSTLKQCQPLLDTVGQEEDAIFIERAATLNHVRQIAERLKNGPLDPHHAFMGVRRSAGRGHLRTVSLLWPHLDPDDRPELLLEDFLPKPQAVPDAWVIRACDALTPAQRQKDHVLLLKACIKHDRWMCLRHVMEAATETPVKVPARNQVLIEQIAEVDARPPTETLRWLIEVHVLDPAALTLAMRSRRTSVETEALLVHMPLEHLSVALEGSTAQQLPEAFDRRDRFLKAQDRAQRAGDFKNSGTQEARRRKMRP